MDRSKKNSGAKRMREQGYVRVDLWFPPTWAGMLREASILYGIPMATLARFLVLAGVADLHERHAIAQDLRGKEQEIFEAMAFEAIELPGLHDVQEQKRQRGKPSRKE